MRKMKKMKLNTKLFPSISCNVLAEWLSSEIFKHHTSMTDYYEILEVAPSATQEEIRSAYIRLALKHHPDRNPLPDSGEIFKQIADAYYTLSDPSRKAEYDKARGSSTPYSPGQVSTTSVFGSVFDELLKPEMDNAPSFYGPVGAVAGRYLIK